jgi:ADP-ribosylglycohydrolase
MTGTDAAATYCAGLIDRAHGSLIGGLIGDAMGTPTEGLEPEEIDAGFGWIEDFEGDGTDDSIMKYLLSDALIATDGNADADSWATQWLAQRSKIGGAKSDRFFASILHAAAKLSYGVLPRRVALGHMPSSTAAMSIAPVGIVNAGHPRAAAAQTQEIASLVHVDEAGFCQDGAVAVVACIAVAMSGKASLDQVIDAATAFIKPWSGGEMIELIRAALALAEETGDYASFRTRYHAKFRRSIACDSRETIPATIALVRLAGGDPRRTVCYAANFGRDTDTIACMAGSIAGALAGASAFPGDWLTKVAREASRDQLELARALVGVAGRKAAREIAGWQPLVGAE